MQKIEKKKLEILKEEQEEKKLLKLQHERDNYDSMTPQEKKAFDVKNEKKLKKQEEKSKKVKVKMWCSNMRIVFRFDELLVSCIRSFF